MSALDNVSETFDPQAWEVVPGFEDLTDLTYHRAKDVGCVRIAFDRPEILNAFRPHTVDELYRTLDHARRTPDVGVVLLTGNGPTPREGSSATTEGWSFCTGGDQRIRGRSGYQYAADPGGDDSAAGIDERRVKAEGGRLHILEVQRLIRTMPKVVIALVGGWAAGGGHSLHVVCDMTLASQHARFKQTDADVGSFDGGYGSAYLAKMVGQKRAREIFFLGRTPSTSSTAPSTTPAAPPTSASSCSRATARPRARAAARRPRAGPSAPAATSASAAARATSTPPTPVATTPRPASTSVGSRPKGGASTSSRSSASSAPCPRSSSRSSAAGPPAAGTRCTSCAT